MQEEKSKIEGFTSAVITAAEQHAARINEETEQLEREAIDKLQLHAGRAADLAAAAPGVELKFVEGAFTLGGLVLDCAEAGRKIDLTFDAALEDLEGRFSEITGFSLEDADGK